MHQQGDAVEAITYPGYSRAARKRKRDELKDSLDKTLAVGRFVVVDLPNDDPLYRLRFGLGKIVAVNAKRIDFNWYIYVGYPNKTNPTYATRWQLQVLQGKGKKIDKGFCHPRQVVMTFEKLTKSNSIPNVGRLAPRKMIDRALRGDFGELPQELGSDDELYDPDTSSESEDEPCTKLRPLTRSERARQRRAKE